jgi:hypothetical protein
VIRKKTQHDMSKVLHLPREMTMEVSEVLLCACHEKCNSSSENVAKVLRLPQNDFRHVAKHL